MDTTEMIPVECVRNLAEEVQELYEAIAARAIIILSRADRSMVTTWMIGCARNAISL
jgi:hypothetical protein